MLTWSGSVEGVAHAGVHQPQVAGGDVAVREHGGPQPDPDEQRDEHVADDQRQRDGDDRRQQAPRGALDAGGVGQQQHRQRNQRQDDHRSKDDTHGRRVARSALPSPAVAWRREDLAWRRGLEFELRNPEDLLWKRPSVLGDCVTGMTGGSSAWSAATKEASSRRLPVALPAGATIDTFRTRSSGGIGEKCPEIAEDGTPSADSPCRAPRGSHLRRFQVSTIAGGIGERCPEIAEDGTPSADSPCRAPRGSHLRRFQVSAIAGGTAEPSRNRQRWHARSTRSLSIASLSGRVGGNVQRATCNVQRKPLTFDL